MGKLVLAMILFLIGLGAFKVLNRMADSAAQRTRIEGLGRTLGIVARLALAAGIIIPVLIVLFSTLVVVPAGHVGVVVLFGQVRPAQLDEGLNLVNPLVDVIKMSVQVHKHSGKYDAASSDLQAVHVEMVLNYRLLPEKAPEVYQKIGTNYASVIIDPAAQEVLKGNTATHVASEILLQRPKIKNEVQTALAAWLTKYGIEMKEVALANIRFDPAYERAIEAKQIEEQKAEQKRYELIQAQRQAEIVVAQAKGEAEAIKVRGEGEATYNQKVAASLTSTLIQQRYLEKWDGKLPQYSVGGSGSGILLQLPAPGDKK